MLNQDSDSTQPPSVGEETFQHHQLDSQSQSGNSDVMDLNQSPPATPTLSETNDQFHLTFATLREHYNELEKVPYTRFFVSCA